MYIFQKELNKDTISTFFFFLYTHKGRKEWKGGRSDLKSLNHHTSPQKKVKTQTTRKKQAMIGYLPSHHTKKQKPQKRREGKSPLSIQ